MTAIPNGSVRDYMTATGNRRWRFVIDVPGKDGRRRQHKRSGFTTRAEARSALDDLRDKLYDGLVPAPDASSVGGFYRAWIEALPAEGIEPATVLHYDHSVRRLLDRIGSVRLQVLSAQDLDAAYADLRAQGLSARSIRGSHVAVRKMLAEARRLGLVARNVSDDARPPVPKAARAKRFPTWTLGELRRFLGLSADDPDATLWSLMAFTGIRRDEAVALLWRDVNLDTGTLTVCRAAARDIGGGSFVKVPKTDAGHRVVELDPPTVRALRAHRADQRERQLLIGPGWGNVEGRVFCEVDGGLIRPGRLTERWRDVVRAHAKAAEVEVIRLHDLRHSHATQLLVAGVRPDVVSRRLGHSSVAFTLQTYGHVVEGDQRAALDLLFGSRRNLL